MSGGTKHYAGNSDDKLLDDRVTQKIESVIPRKKQDVLKWYGWGYKDSAFYVANNLIHFRSKRYPLESTPLPYLTSWVKSRFDLTAQEERPYPQMPTEFPKATINEEFMQELRSSKLIHSIDGEDRLIRCHGQTLHDIYNLWHNEYDRIPDVIVWPQSHNDVVKIVNMAHMNNVVVIPFGGGTSVSGSITCPQDETRMICVLDTSQMNRMLWLDRNNLTVCFESGIVGQDLERELKKVGLTVGHEPDSYEFSTLGGWVATRASGMKKNVYGNIEDLVVRVRFVTPTGVLERECAAPRISCGPDFNHIILGSEGTLGVVTEVVLKVRPLPKVKRYGSLVFPSFDYGVNFMREVARRRCQPASVRLMDTEQFIVGQSLKPAKGFAGNFMEVLKKFYVTTIKGVDWDKICAATLLFEGDEAEVQRQEKIVYTIAKQFKGFSAGSQNGERGYILTFVIAYIRDFALNQDIVAESFETSVSWDRCSAVCHNVKRRVEIECRSRNIQHFLISCRVTQTYDAGACIYFYFGYRCIGVKDPVETYESIENAAREEILSSGGSLSHHHGVGKIRSQWYTQTVSGTGTQLYLAAKRQLDPKNIFAISNLLTAKQWLQEKTDSDDTAAQSANTNNDLSSGSLGIKSKL